MKFKKDWSLAYFLYYMSLLGCIGIVWTFINLISIQFIVLDHIPTITLAQVPVSVVIQDRESPNTWESSGNIISVEDLDFRFTSRSKSFVWIMGNAREHLGATLFFNGIWFLEKLTLFLLFFFGSRILKNVAEKDPFNSSNSRYFFTSGFLMAGCGILDIILKIIPVPLLDTLEFPPHVRILNVDFFEDYFLIAGILLIVFGYVFKEGTRIHEEQKLTV